MGFPWSDGEDAKLLSLRARKVPWRDIPRQMPGRTGTACQMRMHLINLKAQGKTKGNGKPRKSRAKVRGGGERRDLVAKQALAYAVAKAEILAAEQRTAERRAAVAAAKSATPFSPRTLSTHVLVNDAELRSRITLQGLTAGLLGDPLPGRSALDERRARLGERA